MGIYEIKVWFKDSTCRKFVVTDYYFSDENLELIGSDPIEIIIPKENILYYIMIFEILEGVIWIFI